MPPAVIHSKCLKGQWVQVQEELVCGDRLGSCLIPKGTFGIIKEVFGKNGKLQAIIGFWWGSPPFAPNQLETVDRDFFDKYQFTDPPPDYKKPDPPKPPP